MRRRTSRHEDNAFFSVTGSTSYCVTVFEKDNEMAVGTNTMSLSLSLTVSLPVRGRDVVVVG